MKTCMFCGRQFPADLINPLVVSGTSGESCPLCALAKIRRANGWPDYEFNGPRARELYDRAVAHVAAQEGTPK